MLIWCSNNARAMVEDAMQLLLTLDGSSFAESAIPVARQIAWESHSDVHLLAVFEPGLLDRGAGVQTWDALSEPGDTAPEPPVMNMAMEFMLEQYLETVAQLFPGNPVRPAIRVGPHPAEQIAAYAEANDIDLIVMATRGQSGLHRLIYGSVAASVLQSGVAPVALVRPTGKKPQRADVAVNSA